MSPVLMIGSAQSAPPDGFTAGFGSIGSYPSASSTIISCAGFCARSSTTSTSCALMRLAMERAVVAASSVDALRVRSRAPIVCSSAMWCAPWIHAGFPQSFWALPSAASTRHVALSPMRGK
jgi:hypothetical protein